MQWYEKLFENYANQYDKEPFYHGTLGECDFIEIDSTIISPQDYRHRMWYRKTQLGLLSAVIP